MQAGITLAGYAHNTSEPIIRSIYNALDRLGSNGRQV